MKTASHYVATLNELASWNRERSDEELKSFIERRFSSIDGGEIE